MESTTDCRLDEDDDGYGSQFPVDSDFISYSGQDCDDTQSAIHPDQNEFCNEIDDNCDGIVDSGDVTGGITVFTDSDEDGFGDPNNMLGIMHHN